MLINLPFFWHKKKEEVYLTSSHPLGYCSGVHTLLSKVDLYKVSFHQPRSSFIKAVPAVIVSGIILYPSLYAISSYKVGALSELFSFVSQRSTAATLF